MDEAAVVQSAQKGDPEAFGLLVDHYADRIYNLLVRMAGPQEADDLMQETFMKAYANIGTFSGASAFYTWLFQIALNTARSFRRKRSPVTLSVEEEENGNPFDRMVSDNPGPDAAAEKDEQIVQVQAALGQLDDEDREVILLREIEGQAYEDMAASLSISTAAVRSRLHRARKRLIDILGDRLA